MGEAPKMTAAHVVDVNDACFVIQRLLVDDCGFGRGWLDEKELMLARLAEVAAHLKSIMENDNATS